MEMTHTVDLEKAEAAVREADTDTLERWLRNNALMMAEYDPTKESAQLELCKQHTSRIAAELVSRKGN